MSRPGRPWFAAVSSGQLCVLCTCEKLAEFIAPVLSVRAHDDGLDVVTHRWGEVPLCRERPPSKLKLHWSPGFENRRSRVERVVVVQRPVENLDSAFRVAAGEQLAGIELLDVLREHQHREPGSGGPRLDGRPQALVGERRREAYVDDSGVGLGVAERALELGQVVDRGEDLEALGLQQLGQSGAEEGVVFGEDDAHGISHRTTVGPPGGLDTDIVPSNAASRAAMPWRPLPRPG